LPGRKGLLNTARILRFGDTEQLYVLRTTARAMGYAIHFQPDRS